MKDDEIRLIAKANAQNMFFPGINGMGRVAMNTLYPVMMDDAKNLNRYRGPVQVPRIKFDTSGWRESLIEAERPLSSLPYRVKMQQMLMDTSINGHVAACMNKRKNLTLLKEVHICNDNGVTDDAATEIISTNWFYQIRNYIHDALGYGYSLITFGDMINDAFPNIQITRRTDVSPDRLILSSFQYIPSGIEFMNPNAQDPAGKYYYDWSLYVPTPSENGVSRCGYGYLYNVALYEIIMRSIVGWNTDYVEMYGQPTRVISTEKDSEEERDKAEEALRKLASSGYLVKDVMDKFELIESSGGVGTGWQSYANLEDRCKKTISAIILGHEDGISSTPGKLGSGQGGGKGSDVDSSPVNKAMAEKESSDSHFEEFIVNNFLIPKLIKLGIKIPVGKKYKIKNDLEDQQEKDQQAQTGKAWADVAYQMKQAGLKMTAEDFQERTGIETEEQPEPTAPMGGPKFPPNIKAKLNSTYSDHVR